MKLSGNKIKALQGCVVGHVELALEELQLELLFKTGQSLISDAGIARLQVLADVMNNNHNLDLRLDGFADPRGDAEYNQQLSDLRVQAVVKALVLAGLDPARINSFSHGDSQSQAAEGDLDSYALERVVRIELYQPGLDHGGESLQAAVPVVAQLDHSTP